MSVKYPKLFVFAAGIAVLVVSLFQMGISLSFSGQAFVSVALVGILGIPHGATDYALYKSLTRSSGNQKSLYGFLAQYIGIMVGYAFLWWVAPALSLTAFIIVSAYHFGQSNWEHIRFKEPFLKYLTFFSWGLFVIITPVLFNYDVSSGIISELTQSGILLLSPFTRFQIITSVFLFNLGLIGIQSLIHKRQAGIFHKELLNLLILYILFWQTPLLIGFTIYFVFWHSLGSIKDQIQFFRRQNPGYNVQHFIKQAAPFSVLALVFLVLLYGFQQFIQGPQGISVLFMFISLITMPHLYLIDKLFHKQQESDKFQAEHV